MTFEELAEKYQYSRKAYHGIFSLSPSVKNYTDYLLYKHREIDFSPKEFESWYQSNLPIERLTKEVHFCQLSFHLMDGVFCPRYETEMVVEELDKLSPLNGNYIDICSGTGVIGISILHRHPNLKGTLLDISRKAIQNIEINLKRHKIKATVIEGDWFEHLSKNPNYQIITANFPYVSTEDPIDNISSEPKQALYAQKEGWEHYEKLLEWLKTNPHWKIVVLECSAHHLNKWQSIKNMDISLVKDLNNHLRIAIIKKSTYFPDHQCP